MAACHGPACAWACRAAGTGSLTGAGCGGNEWVIAAELDWSRLVWVLPQRYSPNMIVRDSQSLKQLCLFGALSPRSSAPPSVLGRPGPSDHEIFVRKVVQRMIQKPPQLTQLLVCALEDLSVRCNKSDGGTHPLDRNRIKEAFRHLHEAGVVLEKAEVQCLLEYHGWVRNHAKRIGKIAQDIGEGKKPVIKHGPHYHDHIIQEWMGNRST